MKYHYEYELRTNNLCYGNMLIIRGTRQKVLSQYGMAVNKYGCCDIYKIRVYD